jgi:hypothetical protein
MLILLLVKYPELKCGCQPHGMGVQVLYSHMIMVNSGKLVSEYIFHQIWRIRGLCKKRLHAPYSRVLFILLVKKFPIFLESKGSLSSSQEPATGPYSELI